MTATRPDKVLAKGLQAESDSAALRTPIAPLIEAVASHALTEAPYSRRLGQLWANFRISTTGLR
jgi:hypothetical protein